ncbi:MAG: DUF1553 domain-containing protein [Planctomycetota bacterium]|nr:DUF1553 domain-containing protein [Planctomycetota bacterium]
MPNRPSLPCLDRRRRGRLHPSAAIFSVLLLVPVALLGWEASRSDNLVQNSSFEKGGAQTAQAWTTNIWSGEPVFRIDPVAGRTGNRAVVISSEEGGDGSWSFPLKVKPNRDYRVTAWIKTEDVGGGGLGALINLHELQFEGKSDALKGDNDWTRITTEFNSGPRDRLTLNCLFGGWGRATGTAWFDDIEVVQVSKEPEVPQMSEAEAGEFFETKVLPVFQEKCFGCHGSGDKIRADFVMTNREDILAGGESGEAIDLDSPLDSLLVEAINYDSYEMPPDGKLAKEDIDNITAWIQMGAPWKGAEFKPQKTAEAHTVPTVNAETKKWWSYQPVQRPSVPVVATKASHPIDAFIHKQLSEHNLQPNPRASKETLVRRAYYDLTGLPPTPEQVKAFVDDPSPDAWENLIDQLLDSPHYGEKWGRHWLDLVRYAESNSYERDGTKPFVWRYRDYVIRSFNADKPYDQFVIEQLAGDEIPGKTPETLIATGYYRLGKWDDEPVDHKQAWYDDMDDVLATTSQAFLGMTVNCARCHDHKIDPIPTKDYYSMLAFFRNVQRYGVRGHDTVLRQSSRPIVSEEVQRTHTAEVQQYERNVKENREYLNQVEKRVKKDFIPVEHEEFRHEMNRVPLVKQRVGKELDGELFTEEEYVEYKKQFERMKFLRSNRPKNLEAALCVTEKGDSAEPTYVLIRGNAQAESDQVEPGFPTVLSPPEPVIEKPADGKSTGRRTALANWIVDPQNPLAARVMVNRIWQHHFGRGLVRSANDFGFQGTPPTHPELLDWLASEFVEGDWKIKAMHKKIMLSETYQMSSESRPAALAADPTNDHLWRFEMRRLTAEELRDSILAVNQTLNRDKMFGPSIFPKIEKEILHGQSRPGENWGNSSPEDITRRSIYIHIKRSLPVPIMQSFDVADPDSSCPVRFNTVQPTQALGMLNSEFVNDEAGKFAEQVERELPGDLSGQVRLILSRVWQRKPTSAEVQDGVDFIRSLESKREEGATVSPLKLFCVVALNLNEFMYLD